MALARRSLALEGVRRSTEHVAASCHRDDRTDCPGPGELGDRHQISFNRRNRQRQERLKARTNEGISTIMSVRRLFAALIALAVLFAPALTRVGEAYAAVPDHHTQMMTKGHCESPPDKNQEKPADNSCCFQLCLAVATALSAPADRQPLLGSTETPALQSFLVGIPAELATPPPRAA